MPLNITMQPKMRAGIGDSIVSAISIVNGVVVDITIPVIAVGIVVARVAIVVGVANNQPDTCSKSQTMLHHG